MCAAEAARPVSLLEAKRLFDPVAHAPALVLAVSGGPDSTALLVLAARWRRSRKRGPKLLAATVDHGLRRDSKAEAREVSRLARALGVPHRILPWRGKKRLTAIQATARAARYRLLADFARANGADHILTAHTLDDQAETVLMRMSRGSGMTGLGGMRKVTPLSIPRGSAPAEAAATPSASLFLVRPLIELPKARLIATLTRAKITFCEDASNRDPRFARTRLRELMALLAGEGLNADRLAALAGRLRRADAALERAVDEAAARLSRGPGHSEGAVIMLDAQAFIDLPAEIGLRLLGRAIDHAGDEGPVELGKLEHLYEAITKRNRSGGGGLRRTLAGAVVTIDETRLTVERAPPRRREKAAQSLNHAAREAPARRAPGHPTKGKIKKKGDSAGRRLAGGRAAPRLYRGRSRLAPSPQEQAGGSPTAMKDTG